jgi:hypothetical protein
MMPFVSVNPWAANSFWTVGIASSSPFGWSSVKMITTLGVLVSLATAGAAPPAGND